MEGWNGGGGGGSARGYEVEERGSRIIPINPIGSPDEAREGKVSR